MKKDQMPPGRRSALRIVACPRRCRHGGAARHRTVGDIGRGGRHPPGGRPPDRLRPPGGRRSVRPGIRVPAAAHDGVRPAEAPARALPPVRQRPFLRMSEAGRTMVLTFDDGPDPRYTPDILRTLREYDVRAMFFVCGEMATDNRDLLRRMADDGHVVGNHSWSHPLITKLPPSGIRSELGRTSEVIEDVLGTPPPGTGPLSGPGTRPPSRSAPNSAWSRWPGPSTRSTGPSPARGDRAPGHGGCRPRCGGPLARRGRRPRAERGGPARAICRSCWTTGTGSPSPGAERPVRGLPEGRRGRRRPAGT